MRTVGAQAQITIIDHTGDPSVAGTDYVVPTANTFQTVGIPFRLYVRPDAVYNPAYTGLGAVGFGLSTASRWRWVHGVDYATGTQVKAAANENWVQLAPVDLPSAGASRTYWVLETNTAFPCAGTATSHTVTVVDQPAATVLAGVGTGWDILTVGTAFRLCLSGAPIGDVLNITLAEAGAPALANNYTYGITAERVALDAMLVPTGSVEDMTVSHGRVAAPGSLAAGLNPTHTIAAMDLIAVNTPTRYTFRVTDNSVFSTISIRSQVRNGIGVPTGFGTLATTVTYTILPAPVTGPIFHIPNAF